MDSHASGHARSNSVSSQPGVREPGACGELDAFDRVAFRDEASQDGVHESRCPRFADGSSQVHRRADRRVRRNPGESELIEAEKGKGTNRRVARLPCSEVGQPGFQAREITQGPEHQFLGERPLARVEPRVSRWRRLAPSERRSPSTPVRRAWATPRAEPGGRSETSGGRRLLIAARGRTAYRVAAGGLVRTPQWSFFERLEVEVR